MFVTQKQINKQNIPFQGEEDQPMSVFCLNCCAALIVGDTDFELDPLYNPATGKHVH